MFVFIVSAHEDMFSSASMGIAAFAVYLPHSLRGFFWKYVVERCRTLITTPPPDPPTQRLPNLSNFRNPKTPNFFGPDFWPLQPMY